MFFIMAYIVLNVLLYFFQKKSIIYNHSLFTEKLPIVLYVSYLIHISVVFVNYKKDVFSKNRIYKHYLHSTTWHDGGFSKLFLKILKTFFIRFAFQYFLLN